MLRLFFKTINKKKMSSGSSSVKPKFISLLILASIKVFNAIIFNTLLQSKQKNESEIFMLQLFLKTINKNK